MSQQFKTPQGQVPTPKGQASATSTAGTTAVSFQASRAKELQVWDETTQQYLPVAAGSGGGGEAPYWVQTTTTLPTPTSSTASLGSYTLPVLHELDNYTPKVKQQGWWGRQWNNLFGNNGSGPKRVEIGQPVSFADLDGRELESWESCASLSQRFRESNNSGSFSSTNSSQNDLRQSAEMPMTPVFSTPILSNLPGLSESGADGSQQPSIQQQQQEQPNIQHQQQSSELLTPTSQHDPGIQRIAPPTPHQHEICTPSGSSPTTCPHNNNDDPHPHFAQPQPRRNSTPLPTCTSPPAFVRRPLRPAPQPVISSSSPTTVTATATATANTNSTPSPPIPQRKSSKNSRKQQPQPQQQSNLPTPAPQSNQPVSLLQDTAPPAMTPVQFNPGVTNQYDQDRQDQQLPSQLENHQEHAPLPPPRSALMASAPKPPVPLRRLNVPSTTPPEAPSTPGAPTAAAPPTPSRAFIPISQMQQLVRDQQHQLLQQPQGQPQQQSASPAPAQTNTNGPQFATAPIPQKRPASELFEDEKDDADEVC